MKKSIFLLIIPALLLTTSCNKQKEEIARLKAKNDSLLTLKFTSDTTVIEFVKAFNDIQANLDSVKQKEMIISKSTDGTTELKQNAKDQITSDINSIYLLLKKNKEMVAALRAKLSKSDKRIVELETMIDNLNKQIETKDLEIADLKESLSKLDIKVKDLSSQVDNLNQTVDNLSSDNQAKQQSIDEKTAELNTAYYVVGTTAELKEKGIITREGGFIGIGRLSNLKDLVNMDHFTKVDITKIHEIPIMKAKATLITTHPSSSYKFEGEKPIEKLVITDQKAFWSISKYLVISAK